VEVNTFASSYVTADFPETGQGIFVPQLFQYAIKTSTLVFYTINGYVELTKHKNAILIALA
jgi:hypothetical protein